MENSNNNTSHTPFEEESSEFSIRKNSARSTTSNSMDNNYSGTNENFHVPNKNSLDENSLSPSEEKELSGYNEETIELLEKQYQIEQEENTEVRQTSEKPIVRLLTVLTITGAVMGILGFFWLAFVSPRPPRQVAKKPTPIATTSTVPDENSELKGQLAFQDQQSQLEQQKPTSKPQTAQAPDASTPQKPTKTVPPRTVTRTIVRQEPAPPVTPPSPARRAIASNPLPLRTPQVRTPQVIPAQSPAPAVDPLEQWSALAALGQARGVSPRETAPDEQRLTLSTASNESKQPIRDELEPTPLNSNATQENQPLIRSVQLGANNRYTNASYTTASARSSSPETGGMTPGEMGIINQIPTDAGQTTANTEQTKTVAIGTSTPAKVTTPMIWDQSGSMTDNGRFTVTLSKDMLATDGSIALPRGTVLVVQTESVNPGNKLVDTSVVAVVYKDNNSNIKQEQIPPGNILIRGANTHPLLAKNLVDNGGEIARQDLLIGVVGSLGKVGEIINRPKQQTTIQQNSTFGAIVSNSTNSKTNVLAAALEGFFKPMAGRLTTRADRTIKELEQQPNVAVIPEGTQVSIFVNSFLTIHR